MNKVVSKKLLNTKWTAANPVNKEKHFIVVEIVKPDDLEEWVDFEFIKIEAVYSKSIYQIAWKDLRDSTKWQQGWL